MAATSMDHSPEPDEESEDDLLQPVSFDPSKHNPQSQSPLFQKLPAEIRTMIFRFALSEYEDSTRPYPDYSAYRRPGQRGHYLVSTNLLRTCKRVYHEAWYFPFPMADHTFFLTWDERKPPVGISDDQFQSALRIYQARHGYTELEFVTVLAQLWALEPGGWLQGMLLWDNFHPRCVTIVLRYSDWWNWESDESLHLDPQFANDTRFPNSVREIRMEMETTMRRRDQVEAIARAMRDHWRFQRSDGVPLTPIARPRLTLGWTGNAQWINEHEDYPSHRPNEPHLVDYFVEIVRFRSAKLDAEEREEQQGPDNPFLDIRAMPEPGASSARSGDPSSEHEVKHRDIGRIDDGDVASEQQTGDGGS